MEERPPIWRAAANVLNKQARSADKGTRGDPPAWGLGKELTTQFKNRPCYGTDTFASGLY